jgi:hypothetical protein
MPEKPLFRKEEMDEFQRWWGIPGNRFVVGDPHAGMMIVGNRIDYETTMYVPQTPPEPPEEDIWL